EAFPQLNRIAATLRTQHDVNCHDLSASLHTREGVTATDTYQLRGIVDRIGAGDAFAAGVLHGLRTGSDDAEALGLGLAAATLKHAHAGDFNLATRAQLVAVSTGALDVRR
ncbi:MAG: PfkB family carbohydrate kinase, partial [Massilia sp.]